MTFRIGWLSPLTPASGVGTFSQAVTHHFPTEVDGETIDLTLLHLEHQRLYSSKHRCIQIDDSETFHQVLTLFDLLVYNIGNNREHHEAIFNLLRVHPGIIICHDYVYQHYLVGRGLRSGQGFASYAALLLKYDDGGAEDYIRRSRITSRTGNIRYSPWDSEASVMQPMSEAILDLGSALVVHSEYAQQRAAKRFNGPILQLGMPHDQKPSEDEDHLTNWERLVINKRSFHMVSSGYIQQTKCIELILAAIAGSSILRHKLRYTIAGMVGDQSYLHGLQDLVATLSLRDVVVFETNVSDLRLAQLMHEADLFANLRKPNTEGSSASLIEQLDTGKPVVVLASGCYAELDSGAVVKLPPEASATDIQIGLEKLISRPERMPVIGKAGRAQARAWTCASYGEHFVRFARQNRNLLEQRAKAIGIVSASNLHSVGGDEDPWIRNLANARTTLHYFDRHILALDPDLVMGRSQEALCKYVADVIFGIFNDTQLHSSLRHFFAGRGKSATYWACVRFALIVDAVFANDEAARERLVIVGPCYDPKLWAVLEAFPAPQFVAVATLILALRMPQPGESWDDKGRFGNLKRRFLLDLLKDAAPTCDDGPRQLQRWIEQSTLSDLDLPDLDLPSIDRDIECGVGSRLFREHVDLIGFHGQERDHAWSNGHHAFMGLVFGPQICRVEVLVRHIDASLDQPSAVGLSVGTARVDMDVVDTDPHWLGIDIDAQSSPQATLWLQLSTTRAVPPRSHDPRILGVCFLMLRLMTNTSMSATLTAAA